MYKDDDDWRRYKREYNALLKANHLCRNCKGQDGHTLGGFTLCWDCQKKENEKQRKRRSNEGYKAQRRMDENIRYAERKAAGLCPSCGRALDNKAYKTCSRCRASKRRSKNKAEIVRLDVENVNWPRGANGFCWRCNRAKALQGKRLCAGCYDKQLMMLQRTWEVNAERRHDAERKQG